MMMMRGWSPRTTVAQHVKARSESMDDDDDEVEVSTDDGGATHRDDGRGVGAGSRQNFGSITAQGKKNSRVRVKRWHAGSLRPTVDAQ
jgi:hypothetical protein